MKKGGGGSGGWGAVLCLFIMYEMGGSEEGVGGLGFRGRWTRHATSKGPNIPPRPPPPPHQPNQQPPPPKKEIKGGKRTRRLVGGPRSSSRRHSASQSVLRMLCRGRGRCRYGDWIVLCCVVCMCVWLVVVDVGYGTWEASGRRCGRSGRSGNAAPRRQQYNHINTTPLTFL